MQLLQHTFIDAGVEIQEKISILHNCNFNTFLILRRQGDQLFCRHCALLFLVADRRLLHVS